MLIQFTVENHRSIKDPAVISFAASKDKTFDYYLLHPDDKKSLLPVLALFGANAAGKSNVLHALMNMRNMVVGETSRVAKGIKLPYEPFANTTEPTSFEVVYIYNGIKYAYGFSFDDKKIHDEYLYHWPNGREALIFSRENGNYEFRENVSEQITLSNRTPENKLYLVSSNDWNLPQTENAYKWFLEKLTFFMGQTPANSETIAHIMGADSEKSRILKELLVADLGICDVAVYNTDNNAPPVIITTHKIENEDGSVSYFQLRMEKESAGTQRFFSRIGMWIDALEAGTVLVVDEIEASMHPLLTRHLIEMFQDQLINTAHAQLIFATHDTELLDLTLLRRDQVWFVEKNYKTCVTKMYSLYGFSPRKDENIRRGYLQGRYGAIPFIEG